MMSYSDNYRDEKELVNIIIGLTFPRAGFPHPFYDLDYEVKDLIFPIYVIKTLILGKKKLLHSKI